MLLLVVAAVLVVSLLRSVAALDLAGVLDALARLPWWSAPLLLALLCVRQVCMAMPLTILLPGTGLERALVNDLSASTAAAFAPAPSDMVLRVAIFRSWGVEVDRAVVATGLNALTFFIVRFSAPLVGLALLPLMRVPPGLRLLDLASLLLAAVLSGLLVLVVRGEEQAAAVGDRLGRLARVMRPSVRPEGWSDALRRSQRHVAADAHRRVPLSLVAGAGVLLCDLAILTIALRLMGVASRALSSADIASGYLIAYPLTMFPAQGLGVMDSAMLASFAETAGQATLEPAVAAVVVWRVLVILGPFLLGLLALVRWRRSGGESPTRLMTKPPTG